MEIEIAISILEDIRQLLIGKEPKEKALRTIEIYRKNLELATNEKIKRLIEKQKEYIKKYGSNNRKILKINKKIDEEIQKIYNN